MEIDEKKVKGVNEKKELDSCKLNLEEGEFKLKLARKGRYILAAKFFYVLGCKKNCTWM